MLLHYGISIFFQKILIRVLNAGYTVQQYTIGLDAEVIAMDGKALGHSPFSQFSFPFIIPAGKPFRLASARRWDIIIKPAPAGTFPAHVEFFDWVNGKKLGTVSTEIKVV